MKLIFPSGHRSYCVNCCTCKKWYSSC